MLSSDRSPVQGAREQSSETARASLASCTFIWSTYQYKVLRRHGSFCGTNQTSASATAIASINQKRHLQSHLIARSNVPTTSPIRQRWPSAIARHLSSLARPHAATAARPVRQERACPSGKLPAD